MVSQACSPVTTSHLSVSLTRNSNYDLPLNRCSPTALFTRAVQTVRYVLTYHGIEEGKAVPKLSTQPDVVPLLLCSVAYQNVC